MAISKLIKKGGGTDWSVTVAKNTQPQVSNISGTNLVASLSGKLVITSLVNQSGSTQTVIIKVDGETDYRGYLLPENSSVSVRIPVKNSVVVYTYTVVTNIDLTYNLL